MGAKAGEMRTLLRIRYSALRQITHRVVGGLTGDSQSASKPPGKANHVPQQHGHTCTLPRSYFSYQTAFTLRKVSSPGLLGSQGGQLGPQEPSRAEMAMFWLAGSKISSRINPKMSIFSWKIK